MPERGESSARESGRKEWQGLLVTATFGLRNPWIFHEMSQQKAFRWEKSYLSGCWSDFHICSIWLLPREPQKSWLMLEKLTIISVDPFQCLHIFGGFSIFFHIFLGVFFTYVPYTFCLTPIYFPNLIGAFHLFYYFFHIFYEFSPCFP